MKVDVKVDGKKVPLNRFVSRIFANTITAMVSSLRGVDKAKKIVVEVDLD